LDKTIINVNCKTSYVYILIDSVELMLKVVINKCKIRVKGEKEPDIHPWTSYTSALFAMMEGNDEGMDQVSASVCYTYIHTLLIPLAMVVVG
jgi:hypothetical protein